MTAEVIPLPQRRVAIDVLDELPSLVEGFDVRFPPSMPPHIQALMGTLGARVIFDPSIPKPRAWGQ